MLLAEVPRLCYYEQMSITVRDLIRLLDADGWIEVRQRGSHRQFQHATKAGTVTLAAKPSADVPPGTLNSVLKQAGLKGEQRQPGDVEHDDA